MCEMVHRGGQFWHALPCLGLPPCVKWDLSSMLNFSNFLLKLFLIKCIIQPTSIMKTPSMYTQEYSEYFWSCCALLQKCQTPLKLAACCQMSEKVAGKLNRIFGCLLCCSGAQWVMCIFSCETNSFAGEWEKPFWLAWAWLGAIGIHLSGNDSVVVDALVSCLLQVVPVVLFFGRLKY